MVVGMSKSETLPKLPRLQALREGIDPMYVLHTTLIETGQQRCCGRMARNDDDDDEKETTAKDIRKTIGKETITRGSQHAERKMDAPRRRE